ncbi:hypothetical protein PILCRDRAFT_826930, partial [Piloderma croceum F 1598]
MVVADGTDYAVRGHVDSMGHAYMLHRKINCDYGYLPMNCGYSRISFHIDDQPYSHLQYKNHISILSPAYRSQFPVQTAHRCEISPRRISI